jgi:hypothetical protein
VDVDRLKLDFFGRVEVLSPFTAPGRGKDGELSSRDDGVDGDDELDDDDGLDGSKVGTGGWADGFLRAVRLRESERGGTREAGEGGCEGRATAEIPAWCARMSSSATLSWKSSTSRNSRSIRPTSRFPKTPVHMAQ